MEPRENANPEPFRSRLRTSNAIERVNMELKRLTRVAEIFPTQASLLRLISALLVEINDQWDIEKIYLNMQHSLQPSL